MEDKGSKISTASVIRLVLRRLLGCLGCIMLGFIGLVILMYGFSPYEAMWEMERRAVAGDHTAQVGLGYSYDGITTLTMLYYGRYRPDKKKALFWMETAAKAGYSEAIELLPEMLERDYPGQRNSEAVKWYKKSANLESGLSAKRLVDVYTHGQLGQRRDPKEATHWEAVRERNNNAARREADGKQ